MDSVTLPSDRRPIGFWLKLLDRLIDESFDALLGGAHLTRRHWQVLNVLLGTPATVGDVDARLAPFLGAGEPTTRPVLDDLHARGWVAWTGAGRAALTEAGVAVRAEVLTRISDNRRRVTAGVASEEYQATVDVLRRMATNLGWADRAA